MTQQSLRDKARAAQESWGDEPYTSADAETSGRPAGTAAPDLVPMVELTEATSDDPPSVPVAVAWARVMRDVHGIGKHSKYDAPGTRYNFRGVDAVVNAFGPACRRHGVIVLPYQVTASHAPAVSKGGAAMRETTTVVQWRIYGPQGDFIQGASEGESLDTGDKGTAKAQSVALRMFLLAAGLVPTDEKDPDAQHIERGERPLPKAADYVDEICDPRTSPARLRQIFKEAGHHKLIDAMVTNEHGEAESLRALIGRKGAERAAEAGES